MKVPIIHRLFPLLVSGFTVMLLLIQSVFSATTVMVRVTIFAPPPCIINNNNPIEVEFDEIMTTRIDGEQYIRPVNYVLDCTTAVTDTLKVRIQGIEAAFGDGRLLATDTNGLAIRFIRLGHEMPVNSWVNFTYPNTPKVWAVPVKEAGVMLTEGEFSSSATLQVAYQ